jgi:hypothetical protein
MPEYIFQFAIGFSIVGYLFPPNDSFFYPEFGGDFGNPDNTILKIIPIFAGRETKKTRVFCHRQINIY